MLSGSVQSFVKSFAWQCDRYNSLTRVIQRAHFGYHCQRTKVILAASLFFPETWNRWFSFSGYGRWNISHIYSDKNFLQNPSWAIREQNLSATNVEHTQLRYVSHSWHINLVCRVHRLFGQRLVVRERLWGTGILLPQDFCGKTKQAVRGSQSKKLIFFELSRVSPGDQPLTKEPEDSEFQIADT